MRAAVDCMRQNKEKMQLYKSAATGHGFAKILFLTIFAICANAVSAQENAEIVAAGLTYCCSTQPWTRIP
jgi:heme/copper-type cytochrome/quinol oxidase subunit 1